MADIIKTGTVRIDIVRGKSDVKPPDIGPILAAKEKEVALNEQIIAQEKAVQDAAQKAAAAQMEASKRITEDSLKRLDGMSQMAEGLLKIGRAAVLAGTAGGASMKELLTILIAFQIATDLFTGATAALKGFVAWLGAAKIATLGLAGAIAILESLLLPIVIVVAALAAVWLLVATNAEKAKEEQEKAILVARGQTEATQAAIDKSIAKEVELQAAIRATMGERERAAAVAALNPEAIAKNAKEWSDIAAEMPSGGPRQQQESANQIQVAIGLMAEQATAQAAIKDQELARLNAQEQLIQAKVREYDLARKILETEEAKTAAFAAQFGALSKGEQERLKRIDKKISGGEELTKGELRALGAAGGKAAEAAARIYADKGRKAGSDQLLFGGEDTVKKAQQNAQNAAGAISEITGGAKPDEALAQIKAQKAAFEKTFAEFLKTNNEMMRQALNDLRVINQRQKKTELAAAAIKGT